MKRIKEFLKFVFRPYRQAWDLRKQLSDLKKEFMIWMDADGRNNDEFLWEKVALLKEIEDQKQAVRKLEDDLELARIKHDRQQTKIDKAINALNSRV